MERHRAGYKTYADGKKDFTTSEQVSDEYGKENCKIELIENYI